MARLALRSAIDGKTAWAALKVWIGVLTVAVLVGGLRGEATRGKVIQIGGSQTHVTQVIRRGEVPCLTADTHACVLQARRLTAACFRDLVCIAEIRPHLITGPRGRHGRQGDPGPQGPQGGQGIQGGSGVSVVGRAGPSGRQGPSGPTGGQGPPGVSPPPLSPTPPPPTVTVPPVVPPQGCPPGQHDKGVC